MNIEQTQQMIKMIRRIRQRGIGLLELMLSLTIIAILLVAATRYYQSTQTSRQIEVAMQSIQAIYSATQQYYNDNGKVPAGLDDLQKNAMIPTQFATFASPWGETVTSPESKDPKKFTLTFPKNVPTTACANINAKIKANYGTGDDADITVTCPTTTTTGDMLVNYNF